MTRIAMISEHASPLAALGGTDAGGQNVYVAQVSLQLAALGHSVDVFTRREDGVTPDVTELAPGVRVIQVAAGPAKVLPKEAILPHMDEFATRMTSFVRKHGRYDLVHAHFFMSGLVAGELKRALGIPFVVTFHALGRVRRQHQGEADGFTDARFDIEDSVIAAADRVIAECPEDERDLLTLYGADPLRVRMIPCGVDTAMFAPRNKAEARARIGIDGDEAIVLQLGRMVPRKGIDDCIRGFARATANGRKARLIVVGGASATPDPTKDAELARLMQVARNEGAAERVTFAGQRPREQLADYYSAADMFVTTPWYEPFGITPLEAMACGTPVLASEVGGLRYSVVNDVTGYHVPPRDPDALAARIALLLDRPALAAELGASGRRRVEARFTWAQVATQLEEVYRETLAKCEEPSPIPTKTDAIDTAFKGLADVLARSPALLRKPILKAAEAVGDTLIGGSKVLVCGNGGSAADAQHFAAEFVGRFKDPARRALPVIALAADTAFVTAWANDVGYDDVFARGVRAFGQPGDLLLAISTSGRSPNILAALREARERGLTTVALLGGALCPAVPLADIAVRVPTTDTARIQEVQMLALHLVCGLAEERVLAHDAGAASGLLAKTETSA